MRQRGTLDTVVHVLDVVAQNISSEWTCPHRYCWRPSHTLPSQKRNFPAPLAEYMKEASQEDKYRTVATAGAGSILTSSVQSFSAITHCPMVHVPYQGSAPAILSVAGGHVALAIVPFPALLRFQDLLPFLPEPAAGSR